MQTLSATCRLTYALEEQPQAFECHVEGRIRRFAGLIENNGDHIRVLLNKAFQHRSGLQQLHTAN